MMSRPWFYGWFCVCLQVAWLTGCADQGDASGLASPTSFDQDGSESSTDGGPGAQGGETASPVMEDAAAGRDKTDGLQGTPDAPGGSGTNFVLPGPTSIANFRSLVGQGKVPSPNVFSMAGWLNEVGSPLPAADPNHPIDLHVLVGATEVPAGESDVLLQFGFNSSLPQDKMMAPVGLVIALDRSGSMAGQRWQQVRDGVMLVAGSLPAESSLAVLTFGDDVQEVWPAAPWNPKEYKNLADKLDAVVVQGATNLHAALTAAHTSAAQMTQSTRSILLVTDGAATAGKTSTADLLAAAKTGPVAVTVVSIGDDLPQKLLDNMALSTGGALVACPAAADIAKTFANHLSKLLQPFAKDLRVRIDLPDGWQVKDTLQLPVNTDENGVVTLGDPVKVGVEPGADAGATDPDGASADGGVFTPSSGSVTTPVALYASQRAGLLVVRLAPSSWQVGDPQTPLLMLSDIRWQYQLAGEPLQRLHQTSLQVLGLVDVPDEGWQVFSDPIAMRTAALVHLGEGMRDACELWYAPDNQRKAAQERLQAAIQFADKMANGLKDTPMPDPEGTVADGRQLAAKLLSLMKL